MVELYINGKQVELTSDIDINFTYESIDMSNLSNTKNNFSKTVKVKGTPNNNILFNHFFRNDVFLDAYSDSQGYYDPNKKVPFSIMQNGKLLESGYCTLTSIERSIQDISYNFTLYGGLGNFFYDLAYKENGEKKTLADLYYNWAPTLGISSSTGYFNEAEESTELLYKVDAATIAASWRRLNPLKDTSQTQVSDDVVFIPAYTGLNDAFDSKKMIINVYNGVMLSPSGMTSANQYAFNNAFPRSITNDSGTWQALTTGFETIGDPLYGVVELPRDMDPWEMLELRSTEMPMAIRLSKLIDRICDSSNTNVNVTIDDEIKSSLFYKYGWILLGKVNLDAYKNNISNFISTVSIPSEYDDIDTKLSRGANGLYTVTNNNVSYDLNIDNSKIFKGSNLMSMTFTPKLTFLNYYAAEWDTPPITPIILNQMTHFRSFVTGDFSYASVLGNSNYMLHFFNTYTILTFYKENGSTIAAKADLFYFDNSTKTNWTGSEKNNHGWGNYYRNDIFSPEKNGIKPTEYYKNLLLEDLASWLNDRYSLGSLITKKDIFIHNIAPEEQFLESGGITEYTCPDQTILHNVKVNDPSNFSVSQTKLAMTSYMYLSPAGHTDGQVRYSSNFYEFKNYNSSGSPSQAPFFNVWYASLGVLRETWDFKSNDAPSDVLSGGEVNFKLSTEISSSIYSINSVTISTPKLTKSELLSSTLSPAEYLMNFAKAMNLKFDYDFESNSLRIYTLKNYFIDQTIDLDGKVDLSRQIIIKPIADYGIIDVKQEVPDTYANYLYKQIGKETGFGNAKWMTANKTTTSSLDLLEKTTSTTTIDWSLSSKFFNFYPQLPQPYIMNMIDWTLNKVITTPSVKIDQSTISTTGLGIDAYNSLNNVIDEYKKLCLFDKSSKYVDSTSNSFIFLNGYTSNYGYVDTDLYHVLYTKLMITNDAPEQWIFGGGRCYMYAFSYNDYDLSFGFVDRNYSLYASPWYVPLFSRCLSNVYDDATGQWSNGGAILASWNLAKPVVESYIDSPTAREFITDSTYKPDRTIDIASPVPDYNYFVEELPLSNECYLYDTVWKDYLEEMYGKNNRDITLYAKIEEDPRQALKKFYKFEGSLWIITKIENYSIDKTKDNFSKVTLHRISSKSNFVTSSES